MFCFSQSCSAGQGRWALNLRACLFGVLAMLINAPVNAREATAGMVVATCSRALAGGYSGRDAAMCDWHVRPCAVCGKTPAHAFCIPPDMSPAALAREMVRQLRRASVLTEAAKPQIREILRTRYPCDTLDKARPGMRGE